MKKTLLSIASFLSASLLFSQNFLSNGDFEAWESHTLKPLLDEWQTTTHQSALTDAFQRSTDAQNGTYSIRMENMLVQNGTDTATGYAVIGGIGEQGPGPGIPYSTQADTLRGYYKYDIPAGDSATILLMLKSGGNQVGIAAHKFTGTQTSWTEFAVPTHLPTGVTADSIVIGFAAFNVSNDDEGTPGAWLMVDNIFFTGSGTSTPIPNNDFENWTIKTYENPKGWDSFNQLLAAISTTPTVEKVTDASLGSFAAKLSTITVTQNQEVDTIPAVLTNGRYDLEKEDFYGGIAFTDLADTLVGRIKFNMANSDTGGVAISFMKDGNPIDEAFYATVGSQNSYTDFEIPFPSALTAIDTIRISIFSGENPGSEVYIDALNFKKNTVNVGILDLTSPITGFKSFPNPVIDQLNLQFDSEISGTSDFEVFDINGKQILSERVVTVKGANRFEFDLSTLAVGYYNYSFTTRNNVVNGKLVIAD